MKDCLKVEEINKSSEVGKIDKQILSSSEVSHVESVIKSSALELLVPTVQDQLHSDRLVENFNQCFAHLNQ